VSRGSDSTLNWRSNRVYTDVHNKPLGCSEGSPNPSVSITPKKAFAKYNGFEFPIVEKWHNYIFFRCPSERSSVRSKPTRGSPPPQWSCQRKFCCPTCRFDRLQGNHDHCYTGAKWGTYYVTRLPNRVPESCQFDYCSQ